MTEENREILTNLKFRLIEINWIGKIGKYYFDILDKQDSEDELVISVNFAQNENKGRLFEYFDTLEKDEIISSYGMEENVIKVTFLENGKEKLDNLLNNISSNFDSINLECKCNNCSNTQDLNYYCYTNRYMLLCSNCAGELQKKIEEDKKRSGNYVKGFFASLIGALIGSIAWILIGCLGFIASIAGAAISYGAFKGYNMAKGKISKTGVVINVITIIIAFLFANYAGIFIQFMKEVEDGNLLYFILVTPYLFSDAEFLGAVLKDLLLGILFAFLGSSKTVSDYFNQAKHNDNFHVEKIEF